jgi:hypothetical protein
MLKNGTKTSRIFSSAGNSAATAAAGSDTMTLVDSLLQKV